MQTTQTNETRKPRGARAPEFKYGDTVQHDGQLWAVAEDLGGSILLRRGDNRFKTVLPSEVERSCGNAVSGRSIKEVMAIATGEQRGKIIAAIMADGVSAFTAASYCNGTRRPKYLYQVQIQRHIKRFLGVSASIEDLFR